MSSESAGLNHRGIDESRPTLHADFLLKARTCAFKGNVGLQYRNENSEELTVDDFYVVWFAKNDKNWMAIVSTDAVKGHYWEVMYDGDKEETYVETYLKHAVRVIFDNDLDVPPSR